jgi:FkbM family methyltransferase
MTLYSSLWRMADSCLPSRSDLLYRIGRKLAQRHLGEGDDDMWRNGEMLIARQILKGSVAQVADVGANLGEWSKAIRDFAPNVGLHLFEPVSATFKKLSACDWPEGTHLNQAAVGDSPAIVTLHVGSGTEGSNSLYLRSGIQVSSEFVEKVPCLTIDEYCRTSGIPELGFLKIDVEGHELAVMRGAMRMLREQRIAAMQFEYGGTYIDARVMLKDVFSYLAENAPGYRIYKIHGRGLLPAGHYQQCYENFQYANWLVAREHLISNGPLSQLVIA